MRLVSLFAHGRYQRKVKYNGVIKLDIYILRYIVSQLVIMKVLISGAYGQVGQELIKVLGQRIGLQNVICTDVRLPPSTVNVLNHEYLDIHNKDHLFDLIKKHQVTDIYCLASLLSATGQVYPLYTENINMTSLFNCLQAGRLGLVKKIFWPSSIAAFGANTPKKSPQHTIQQPNTVYGITKKSGQLWCNYYYNRYGVDVRSLRYPGLIGHNSPPGGGTTDYAIWIFHKAIMGEKYTCYVEQNTPMSMMHMQDAMDATMQLMDAKPDNLTIRTSYNIQSMTFTPLEIYTQIKKHIPNFEMDYKIEEVRQRIANTWPSFFVDERARKDWGWQPKYTLESLVTGMIKNLTREQIIAMRPVK